MAQPTSPTTRDRATQVQLSRLYSMFALSSLLFDGRDAEAIVDLAAEWVSTIGGCRTQCVYRYEGETLVDSRDRQRKLDTPLDAVVMANPGLEYEIVLADSEWRYAINLVSPEGVIGVIVAHAAAPPSPDELFALKVVAQQTAAALLTADLRAGKRANAAPRHSRAATELPQHNQVHERPWGVAIGICGFVC
jgi:hypothetical protein